MINASYEGFGVEFERKNNTILMLLLSNSSSKHIL